MFLIATNRPSAGLVAMKRAREIAAAMKFILSFSDGRQIDSRAEFDCFL